MEVRGNKKPFVAPEGEKPTHIITTVLTKYGAPYVRLFCICRTAVIFEMFNIGSSRHLAIDEIIFRFVCFIQLRFRAIYEPIEIITIFHIIFVESETIVRNL